MNIPEFLEQFAEYQKENYFKACNVPESVQKELELRISFWLAACAERWTTVQETVERINKPFDENENLSLYAK